MGFQPLSAMRNACLRSTLWCHRQSARRGLCQGTGGSIINIIVCSDLRPWLLSFNWPSDHCGVRNHACPKPAGQVFCDATTGVVDFDVNMQIVDVQESIIVHKKVFVGNVLRLLFSGRVCLNVNTYKQQLLFKYPVQIVPSTIHDHARNCTNTCGLKFFVRLIFAHELRDCLTHETWSFSYEHALEFPWFFISGLFCGKILSFNFARTLVAANVVVSGQLALKPFCQKRQI